MSAPGQPPKEPPKNKTRFGSFASRLFGGGRKIKVGVKEQEEVAEGLGMERNPLFTGAGASSTDDFPEPDDNRLKALNRQESSRFDLFHQPQPQRSGLSHVLSDSDELF